MRCFFNAAGLKPDIEIAKLRSKHDDPTVRYMLANEIISAAASPLQIPREVKEVIQYTLYETERKELDEREEFRSDMLVDQNPNGNLQDTQNLPIHLQGLGKQGEYILEKLRQRSLSLAAFEAFLNYHIRNEEMMVALYDVQGDEQENPNANYTSIDAVAYVNNLGIKIYKPDGGLHLAHQFIPQEANKVVYLYHEGSHFQALIPE